MDVAALLPSMGGLTERQQQLFFLFQSVIARSKPEGLARLTDEDVAEAASACAATIETAAKGVLYEHSPAALPAQKLAGEFRTLLAQVREHGATVYDREAAIALRAIERGARSLTRPEEPTAYLALMGRLLQANKAAAADTQGDAAPAHEVRLAGTHTAAAREARPAGTHTAAAREARPAAKTNTGSIIIP
jgi:hypothetical protein